jgi:hypothetical protein
MTTDPGAAPTSCSVMARGRRACLRPRASTSFASAFARASSTVPRRDRGCPSRSRAAHCRYRSVLHQAPALRRYRQRDEGPSEDRMSSKPGEVHSGHAGATPASLPGLQESGATSAAWVGRAAYIPPREARTNRAQSRSTAPRFGAVGLIAPPQAATPTLTKPSSDLSTCRQPALCEGSGLNLVD